MTLLTDEYYWDGTYTYPKPKREDYPSDVTWLRFLYAWKDRISADASRAFAEQFARSMRE